MNPDKIPPGNSKPIVNEPKSQKENILAAYPQFCFSAHSASVAFTVIDA